MYRKRKWAIKNASQASQEECLMSYDVKDYFLLKIWNQGIIFLIFDLSFKKYQEEFFYNDFYLSFHYHKRDEIQFIRVEIKIITKEISYDFYLIIYKMTYNSFFI